MIRRMYSDLTPEELAVATPDPKRLVSFGEVTRFDEVLTAHGRKSVPVVYEVLAETEGSIGFGHRVWYRFRDNPNILVPQFDLQKRDTVQPEEPFSEDEIAALRASLPQKDPPIPEPPPQPVGKRPDW